MTSAARRSAALTPSSCVTLSRVRVSQPIEHSRVEPGYRLKTLRQANITRLEVHQSFQIEGPRERARKRQDLVPTNTP
jgi:hypothetical protein